MLDYLKDLMEVTMTEIETLQARYSELEEEYRQLIRQSNSATLADRENVKVTERIVEICAEMSNLLGRMQVLQEQ